MCGVLLQLEGLGEIAFALDQRDQVAAAFARYFKGALLDGPPWAVTPYERLPTKDAYLAGLSDF